MDSRTVNKKKIINDPVYGFIGIPYEFIYDLIAHPWVQRLRNIRQLGLTHLVYPGAVHTRFHHALGSMYLVCQVLEILRGKGIQISEAENEAVLAAILLHDIGHGPFSHTLENILIEDLGHEEITLSFMKKLNVEFGGRLEKTIEIFTNRYPRKFFHQMVSGQLDMDRMDYLNRDSFFTGVSEGVISFDRIIKMLNVSGDKLVVEEKGLYSIEKFLIARRLMYWQVYFHKTVIAAEQMLIKVVSRAKELCLDGAALDCTPALRPFLSNHIHKNDFNQDERVFNAFTELDDHDIMSSVKMWKSADDQVLSMLSNAIILRNLYQVEIRNEVFSEEEMNAKKNAFLQQSGLSSEVLTYFVFTGRIKNLAYDIDTDRIEILRKNGELIDFAAISDYFSISGGTRTVEKHFFCSFRQPSRS